MADGKWALARAVVLGLWLAVIAGIPLAAAQQWQEYRPVGAGFRIELPGMPAIDARRIRTPQGLSAATTSAEVRLDGRRFLVVQSVFDDVLGDAETMLGTERENLLADRRHVVREKLDLRVGEATAMRLVIDMPGDAVAVVLMAFEARRLHQAVYYGPARTEGSADVQRFIGSFALLP